VRWSNGTTESLPWRTSGESANNLFDLTSARETGLGIGLPALILIGDFGSESSTETTAAVPTALFRRRCGNDQAVAGLHFA